MRGSDGLERWVCAACALALILSVWRFAGTLPPELKVQAPVTSLRAPEARPRLVDVYPPVDLDRLLSSQGARLAWTDRPAPARVQLDVPIAPAPAMEPEWSRVSGVDAAPAALDYGLIGTASCGERTVAVVEAGGEKRLVEPGSRLDRLQVTHIERHAIVLRDERGETRRLAPSR
ncbi:MAG: hypothetical protein M5U26_10940 [Planctomycetota bacterium]|nr:hypothetical protein [Planctomycetota bacterium]